MTITWIKQVATVKRRKNISIQKKLINRKQIKVRLKTKSYGQSLKTPYRNNEYKKDRTKMKMLQLK